MSECEIITILQELFSGVKRSSLVNLTLSEEHQVEMWLDDKLSEAATREKKNSRPVIADGVEYDSYADYLKSREEKE